MDPRPASALLCMVLDSAERERDRTVRAAVMAEAELRGIDLAAWVFDFAARCWVPKVAPA